MRILITGFGPFGNVVDNPSARLAEQIAAERVPGHLVLARVLPVSFERAGEEIASLLTAGQFDVALLLGVAGTEPQIRLERCARNRDNARIPDCDGSSPLDSAIAPNAPELYLANADVERLVAELAEAGLPARVSEDAGGYVCNHTYFAALHTIAANRLPVRCLFVHVPADQRTFEEPSSEICLPFDVQVAAIRWILRALVAGG